MEYPDDELLYQQHSNVGNLTSVQHSAASLEPSPLTDTAKQEDLHEPVSLETFLNQHKDWQTVVEENQKELKKQADEEQEEEEAKRKLRELADELRELGDQSRFNDDDEKEAVDNADILLELDKHIQADTDSSVVVLPASGDDDGVQHSHEPQTTQLAALKLLPNVDTLMQQVKVMQANSAQLELPLQDASSAFYRMKSKCYEVVKHSRKELRRAQEDTLVMQKQLSAASLANREELEERLAVLKGFNAIALVEIEKERARVEHAREQLSRLKEALCVRQEQRVAKAKQPMDKQFAVFQKQQIQARIGEENRHIQYVQATQAKVKGNPEDEDYDANVAAKTAEIASAVAKETQQAVQHILNSVKTLELETKKMQLDKRQVELSAMIASKQKLLNQQKQKEEKQKQKQKKNKK
jgi:hypothetical protein